MHVHGAGLDVRLGFPDGFEQLRASLDASPALDEREQELVFGCGEIELLAVKRGTVRQRSIAIGPADKVEPALTAGEPKRRNRPLTRSESSWGENGLVR